MPSFLRGLAAALCLSAGVVQGAGQHAFLSVDEAVDLALAADPELTAIAARGEAVVERAAAAAALPDPMLRAGAVNFPVDGFDVGQEPMTQWLVGVRQDFPRGESRALERERGEIGHRALEARALDRRRVIRREVRLAWLDVWRANRLQSLLAEERGWFRELERAVAAVYGTGGRRQQDLIRIELERQRLDERVIRARRAELEARARLARWIGAEADRPLPDAAPRLEAPRAPLDALAAHPRLVALDREIDLGSNAEALAEQRYKPAFGLDLSYGIRAGEGPGGDDRPDFFSAMLTFDLPVFTGERQDRQLAASRLETAAARNARADVHRMLAAGAMDARRRLAETERMAALYDDALLGTAAANVEATLSGYGNRTADFDELIGAEQTRLEMRIRRLDVETERLRAVTSLDYYLGDTP